jgi:hypothetical protein
MVRISGTPIPIVSMNGSQTGFVTRLDTGVLDFEEVDAFPLSPSEIDEVLKGGVNEISIACRSWNFSSESFVFFSELQINTCDVIYREQALIKHPAIN